MKKPTFTNKQTTSENKYLRTIQRDFVDSQGREGNIITMESQNNGNGSFIFAITRDRKVILNKEYKFGPDDFFYTFPSGWIETGLSGKENILKELQEETGHSTDISNIKYVGKVYQNSYMVGFNELYFADNCYYSGDKNTHEGEEIENHLFDISELEKMFSNNEIVDPYTVALYYMVKEKTNNFTNLDI